MPKNLLIEHYKYEKFVIIKTALFVVFVTA